MEPISINIDFTAIAQSIVDALITGVQTLVSGLPMQLEQWALDSMQSILSTQNSANVLTQIPLAWTTRDSDVISLFQEGRKFQFALFCMVLCIQGFRVMSGKADLWEAVFRTGWFTLLGAGMLVFADPLIGVVNDLSAAVMQTPVDLTGQALPNALELGILLIAACIFAFFAWIKGAVGVVFIKVLLVLAPYFLTISALPVANGLGQWWVEESTTWLLRPFVVALVFRLGLGLAGRETGALGLLFTLVTFWLAYTMDTRIRRLSVGAWGSISQLSLLSRAARGAAALAGGPAAAPVAVGAAAAGAVTGAAASVATP